MYLSINLADKRHALGRADTSRVSQRVIVLRVLFWGLLEVLATAHRLLYWMGTKEARGSSAIKRHHRGLYAKPRVAVCF